MKDANDPTWQTEEETKFYQKIEDDLEAESRVSNAPAQGSEARPGVGSVVESNAADEKGLASRVEELEAAARDFLRLARHDSEHIFDEEIDGVDSFEYGCSVCTKTFNDRKARLERALAGKKEK